MNMEKISALYREYEDHYGNEKNRIVRGLNILAKYCDDVSVSAGHDIIYTGLNMSADYNKFTEEDVRELFKMDWMWDDEYECFSHFT